jgi:hypothetical protein
VKLEITNCDFKFGYVIPGIGAVKGLKGLVKPDNGSDMEDIGSDLQVIGSVLGQLGRDQSLQI